MATAQISNIMDEVLDLLVSSPTPEQIIAFHASEANRNGKLAEHENAELEEMSRVDHFVTLIKARAMKLLQDRKAADK
jgi:hypothetical protein